MAQSKKKDPSQEKENKIDEAEVRQESSKAANSAISAQKKSRELKDAANATGDPDERQRLTEQAIDAQIQAESFGKTAKYLRSGTFQGMAMGTGLGVAPGATLGALTGTLVGGVSSTILGGLGGSVGAATGYLHGPFVNLGEKAGKGLQKATGINTWGWKASGEQKKQLEKMVGQVNEEDMPGDEELKKLQDEGGAKEGWLESAQKASGGSMPEIASVSKAQGEGMKGMAKNGGKSLGVPSATNEPKEGTERKAPAKRQENESRSQGNRDFDEIKRENETLIKENEALRQEIESLRAEKSSSSKDNVEKSNSDRKKPRKLDARRSSKETEGAREDPGGGPRTSEARSEGSSPNQRKPRKLEKRSDE